MAHPNSDGSEFDERETVGGEIVVSGAADALNLLPLIASRRERLVLEFRTMAPALLQSLAERRSRIF